MKNLILAMFCLYLGRVEACSCGEFQLDLPFVEMGWMQSKAPGMNSMVADVIFDGLLIRVRKNQAPGLIQDIELVFLKIKSYKGPTGDTVSVLTQYGEGACGFSAALFQKSLVFGFKAADGHYLTYSSNCCKSISGFDEPLRYEKYITCLESLSRKIDGEYSFYQSSSYWRSDSVLAARYRIRNGKLDGLWEVYDRKGNLLESGIYINGLKEGVWRYYSRSVSDLGYGIMEYSLEKTQYRLGKALRTVTILEDREYKDLGKAPLRRRVSERPGE